MIYLVQDDDRCAAFSNRQLAETYASEFEKAYDYRPKIEETEIDEQVDVRCFSTYECVITLGTGEVETGETDSNYVLRVVSPISIEHATQVAKEEYAKVLAKQSACDHDWYVRANTSAKTIVANCTTCFKKVSIKNPTPEELNYWWNKT
jgi:hypothetical protein